MTALRPPLRPRAAAAVKPAPVRSRIKSRSNSALCGAPHKADYAEPGIMQSCASKVDVPQALYRQNTPHYRRSNKDLVTASGALNQ
jgi:hypothetical protein